MRNQFYAEAAKCRTRAKEYIGRDEESFLLRVAREFEQLAQAVAEDRSGARLHLSS